MPETDHIPEVGQTWRRLADDSTWTLAGRKTRSWVLVSTIDPVVWVQVGLVELGAQYAYDSCNHDSWCCRLHRVHTMPHRGCILR